MFGNGAQDTLCVHHHRFGIYCVDRLHESLDMDLSSQSLDAQGHGPASDVTPRIIIHGGAGAILESKFSPERRRLYRNVLLSTVRHASDLLANGESAVAAATAAVARFEDSPLFNSGHGAVFTRAGTIELEASVMVSRGYKKRAAAVSLIRHVKNPVMLARQVLERGEQDMEGSTVTEKPSQREHDLKGDDGNPDGGIGWSQESAGQHCHISGPEAERLAQTWGLKLVDTRYFWTKKRWDEHRRGLRQGAEGGEGPEVPTWAQITADADGNLKEMLADEEAASSWDGFEYLPQGTVGAVALDFEGMLCAATSTGGLTNKLPGRIGDTPTIGAGFWAEEWRENGSSRLLERASADGTQSAWSQRPALPALWSTLASTCVPWVQGYLPVHAQRLLGQGEEKGAASQVRALALSGTGNGDSFLRLGLARWTCAIPRLIPSSSLGKAINGVLGHGGELERSAGDRFGRTGEGEGGAIGIELKDGKGSVVADFNCGGMFRAWIDDEGNERARIWRRDLTR